MKDYSVRLDGITVDLVAKQSVTLERYNPLFDFDEIRGNKVLDYVLPFSATNDKIFGWYGLQMSNTINRKYYCEKYAESILFEKGWVELLDTSDEGYSVFFSQNLGDFFGDYQNTTLNLINFGNDEINVKVDYNYLSDAVAYPSIKNKAFFGDNVRDGWNGIVNEVSAGVYNLAAPVVPMVGLRYVFEQISALCNVRFEGEFFETEWYKRGLLDNTVALDDATMVRYQDHLPRLTIPELLKELAKLLNCVIYIDTVNRVIKIRMREERMQQPTLLDLTSKVKPTMSRKPERAKRLELDWELDPGDNLMKIVPADFLKYQSSGADENFFLVKTQFSTRLKDEASGLAICEQVGISDEFNQQGGSFSPKILLWNGVIDGVPVATNEFGTNRLAYHGTLNLVESNWKYFEDWRRRTASRSVLARLNALDLAKLDYHATGGEISIVHVHGRDYYVDNIRVNLPIDDYATLELWEK